MTLAQPGLLFPLQIVKVVTKTDSNSKIRLHIMLTQTLLIDMYMAQLMLKVFMQVIWYVQRIRKILVQEWTFL